MRLLLVEDDVALGEGIHQALRREGYTVDWLQDGNSALHSLLSEIFDLAVLDLGLPRMDGLEVLRRLRDRPRSSTARSKISLRSECKALLPSCNQSTV